MALHVLIIGAGLGGLSCAIACRREGLKVIILEQSKELSEIGAGIQLPPNATRIMHYYGLLDQLTGPGQAICPPRYHAKDYVDGRILAERPGREWQERQFGFAWYAIHRADYQRVLADEAIRLGAELRLDQHVSSIDCSDREPSVVLEDGTRITADVVVGADGLSSIVRPAVIGDHNISPVPSGDMAYRATITQEQIKELPEDVQEVYSILDHRAWWGPDSHAMLYPIRHGKVWNMVLVLPDNLPPDVARDQADIAEMQAKFDGWDPMLKALIDNVKKCLKWKIRTMDALPTWVKGSVTLLGDACHPTLPNQAQGAAMAVEDGAVLGKLLGLCSKHREQMSVPSVLALYQSLRLGRTTINVNGAVENRKLYHMRPDDAEYPKRNEKLSRLDWDDPDGDFPWPWACLPYLKDMLAFDSVLDAEEQFWKQSNPPKTNGHVESR